MSLSNDLISQFVKATNDTEKSRKETTAYGTIKVGSDGKKYVQLDGSNVLTPVTSTVGTKEGDRVIVMIKNHTATITGNVDSPSLITDDISGIAMRVESIEADNAVIHGQLTSNTGNINSLDAKYITVNEKLVAAEADIDILKATTLTVEVANATYATIANLEATDATIHNLEATYGKFEELITTDLEAITGVIENLDTTYANIDFSNIGKAAMEYFYAQSGLIKDVTIGDATITGELVGVTISGDLIKANTLVADKLVIQGVDGLYYRLNAGVDGVTEDQLSTEEYQNHLHGENIITRTITADKISVTDLEAFGATVGGFKLTEDSVYSGVKDTVDNTTAGLYLDSTGQVAFGDTTNYIKYYKDTNGKFKLDISAESLNLAINAAAKTATNYMSVNDSGLVIGDLAATTLGKNVLIDSDSVDIRNGDTTLASFGADYLYLAKNSRNAKIDLCNGLATLYHESKYSYDSVFIIDSANTEILGVINPLCLTSTDDLGKVSIQFANANGVMGGLAITGDAGKDGWLRRCGRNMFDMYTILDSGNFYDVMDSGWIFGGVIGEKFTLYDNDYQIQYRKIGKMVEIRGVVQPVTTIPGSTDNHTIFTLQEGYRPSKYIYERCQGTGSYSWLLSITTGGVVRFARYNDGSNWVDAPTTAWLPFHITFFVD
jgi:hypothetical protein